MGKLYVMVFHGMSTFSCSISFTILLFLGVPVADDTVVRQVAYCQQHTEGNLVIVSQAAGEGQLILVEVEVYEGE